MQRDVSSHIVLATGVGRSTLAFQVALPHQSRLRESLTLTLDGRPLALRELDHATGRTHAIVLPADTPAGLELVLDYRATAAPRSVRVAPGEDHGIASLAEANAAAAHEMLEYVLPSRYVESDALFPTARAEFDGLDGVDLVLGVRDWVHHALSYVPGSTLVTDTAVSTLLARKGVCRDYAHLVCAMLRACDVPARVASVYAPGLSPMDFHAVAEAWVGGTWVVVDATGLAPRESMVRIATGRDAADTAFLSNYGAVPQLKELTVMAVVDGDLPVEDPSDLIAIA